MEIIYSPGAGDDLARIAVFLESTEGSATAGRIIGAIRDAIGVLVTSPYVGRPAPNQTHQLIVSRGRTGYIVGYKVDEAGERILVENIRHQREAGYR